MLLWSGVLTAGALYAQLPDPLRFRPLTINEGLSQGFVACIFRDHQGFMWLATGDGLNKYDGYGFTVFHHVDSDTFSLASDDLTAIYEDGQERMWIGTRHDGLELFDRKSNHFTHYREGTSGLWSDNILGITGDRKGQLWVRTRAGIDRVVTDGGMPVFTHIPLDSLFEKGKDRYGAPTLFIDSRGHIYLLSNTRIAEFIGDTLRHSFELEDRYRFPLVDSFSIPSLLEDTVTHSLLLKTNAVIAFPHHDFTAAGIIYPATRTDMAWAIDKTATLWLADTAGIVQIQLKTGVRRRIVPADPAQGKALSASTFFFADSTGVVWLGSGGYGLLMFDPEQERFRHLTPGVNTYQLLTDKAGGLLTNHFARIDLYHRPAEPEQLADEQTIRTKFARIPAISFARDETGKLWMGIHGGILRYDPVTRQTTRFDLPFEEPVLPFPLYAGSHNTLWMGFGRYFVQYDIVTGHCSRAAYPDPTPRNTYDYDFLQAIYEQDGLLWLGSVHGLFCWDIGQQRMLNVYYHRQQDTRSISNDFILSFCPDSREPHRYLWIGTRGGLNRLDRTTGRFIRFTRESGLPDNVIYGILPDGDGNLWLSMNRGLSALHVATRTIRNFDVGDGLQGNEFNRFAACRMADGSLAFGGLNGITWFDPKEIRPLEAPPVVITGVRLFNKPDTGPVTDTQSLRYSQNVLTLRFAAMDYRKHGSLRYRCRLEGFDRDWIDEGANNEATYTNLDPGTYTFRVQASFTNGAWGSRTASMTIRVLPPWWKTAWFYACLAGLILALLYTAHRYRIRQLSRAAALRDRIARDLHDEVGSSVSTIAIYSKIAFEQAGNPDFDNTPILRKVTDYATEIMESMNDIVWSINTRNDSFGHIVSRMRDHASQLLEAGGYTLQLNFDDGLNNKKLDMEKRRNLYLIFKEALNNIVKYARGNNVWITLSLMQGQMQMTIRDDGKGFDPGTIKKGNGLSNMRHRSKSLRGQLSIKSSPGQGTIVIIVFPA